MNHATKLSPGKSAEVVIFSGLTYLITNNGWNITITCTAPMRVSPVNDKEICISASTPELIDEFLGING